MSRIVSMTYRYKPRRRCWDYDWVVEFDIRSFLDAVS